MGYHWSSTLLLLIFFFSSIQPSLTFEDEKTYTLALTMCVAPKKYDMVSFTIDYLLNAYSFDHSNINITFFITRGCVDCDFEGYHKVVDALTLRGITVYEVTLLPISFRNDKTFREAADKFESWVVDFKKEDANNRPFHRWKHFTKDNVINYYSLNLALYAKNTINPDFIMFLEDDTSFDRKFFQLLYSLFSKYHDGENVLIRTIIDRFNLFSRVIPPGGTECLPGFFGILLGRKEAKRFFKMYKYDKYAVCGDAFNCYMSEFLKLPTPVYHWGKHLSKDVNWDVYWNIKDMLYWEGLCNN
ncbi:hypothetical protein EIN_003100 [Entamoeba invadens IP1]|uniref:Uncharacterized protein n=1 Tax=Entamoeba invadens IP1 TaxID=370355 RepID=A0A0A1TWC3_ENTIV|nr:hypothetical protein EIN_003100 [Entamoeba invadens IP1]ELP84925.1 hypothetical protein EIN_003100 [Entamoeba invadens IP1]|eukprot:XP_004184271.1 hypothetical protein EIN_003100 [Entamoeba invadens IP1]